MVEMSTHFDPAAQLSKLSERLNHLEENLDEKSICLQQQRATLQGFNDDILVLQTSEQNHLQACGEKIAALGTLQARMECILQRQRSISCGHHVRVFLWFCETLVSAHDRVTIHLAVFVGH